MRIWLTGASGFVGSAFARVLRDRHGHELLADRIELADRDAVAAAVDAFEPDAVVHCAILKDLARIEREPTVGWAAYVGATSVVVDAANRHGAQVILVSTDWVFDGVRGGYAEGDSPGPLNAYGYLKAASELVTLERARRGAVARIAGVQGLHWARPDAPRAQGAGFGDLALAVVDALADGRRMAVWSGPAVNEVASPILSTDAADVVERMLVADARGIVHCAGREAVDRVGLAHRAAAAFGLDASLLDVVAPPAGAAGGLRVPRDTSLASARTERDLGVELPDVDATLRRLEREWATGAIA